MKECVLDDVFTKKVFYFINNDRSLFNNVKFKSKASIRVMDEENEMVKISFIVTRDAYLGKNYRWIYGKVLNQLEDRYYQIEFKLNLNDPEEDTVEVFLQAPPVSTKKPR